MTPPRIRLAFSSLAWSPAQDDAVRAMLVARGVTGIELTPFKYWAATPDVSANELATYRAAWSDAGISVVALQGILFGKPALQLFGSAEQRSALERHLAGMAMVAQSLGATVIVLGAPQNRLRGALSEEAAVASAAPALRRIGDAYVAHGCVLCVEPNPARYGGDFVRDLAEARRLVEVVAHPGFALHLDAGALAINDEADEDVVAAARTARHVHISEVDLAPVGAGSVDHRRMGRLLREAGYDGWVSIEMKPVEPAKLADSVHRAIDVAVEAYGPLSPWVSCTLLADERSR